MKTKDLMVDNYVLVEPSKMPIKIAAVHHKKVAYHACVNKLTWVRECLLRPIPLTSEILIKNGICTDYSEDKGYCCFDDSLHIEISIEKGKIWWTINWAEYSILELKYVHELQNALRLCGIDKEIIL